LGSADLMPRNLDRRVEQLFPVADPHLCRVLRDDILKVHLQDSAQARRLLPDGEYEWVQSQDGDEPLNSQLWMIEHRGSWNRED
jgi:polyphosphate kinase